MDLRTLAVTRGFATGTALAEATGLPQPRISAMMRGSREYPLAVEKVAAALGASVRTVESAIEESREQATRKQRTRARRSA